MDLREEYGELPVAELSPSTRRFLARRLDPITEDYSKDNVAKNWEGLAELMNFNFETLQNFRLSKSATTAIIEAYSHRKMSTVRSLLSFLKELELQSIANNKTFIKMLEKDLHNYKERGKAEVMKQKQLLRKSVDFETAPKSKVVFKTPSLEEDWDEVDRNTDQYSEMVVDDKSGAQTHFAAFVSYCHDDLPFVKEMIVNLEKVRGLKLCVSDRDLLAGCSKHFVTARLIADRCDKVIFVLSPKFLVNPECEFHLKLALSLSIANETGKPIIPVIYRPCKVPTVLTGMSSLDYSRRDLTHRFWLCLAEAVKKPQNHGCLISPQRLRNLVLGVEKDLKETEAPKDVCTGYSNRGESLTELKGNDQTMIGFSTIKESSCVTPSRSVEGVFDRDRDRKSEQHSPQSETYNSPKCPRLDYTLSVADLSRQHQSLLQRSVSLPASTGRESAAGFSRKNSLKIDVNTNDGIRDHKATGKICRDRVMESRSDAEMHDNHPTVEAEDSVKRCGRASAVSTNPISLFPSLNLSSLNSGDFEIQLSLATDSNTSHSFESDWSKLDECLINWPKVQQQQLDKTEMGLCVPTLLDDFHEDWSSRELIHDGFVIPTVSGLVQKYSMSNLTTSAFNSVQTSLGFYLPIT